MKHTIGGQSGTGCAVLPQGQGNLVKFHIFFIFPISQEYNDICLHFVIECMYCYSLKIPAKYHDNRLDIFNVGSTFLSYAFLLRLPLQNLYFILPQVIFDTINTKTNRFIENWQTTSIYYKNDIEMLISRPLKKVFITSCVYRKYVDSLVTTLMFFPNTQLNCIISGVWLYFKPLFIFKIYCKLCSKFILSTLLNLNCNVKLFGHHVQYWVLPADEWELFSLFTGSYGMMNSIHNW